MRQENLQVQGQPGIHSETFCQIKQRGLCRFWMITLWST
jgi:hypothetical protein